MSLHLGNTKIPGVRVSKEIIGGVILPELDNPASNANVIQGYEYIDEDGNKKTGSFTVEPEISEQDTLLSELQTVLSGKAAAIPTLQTKSVTPTTSEQNVTPDNGYDGLSKVTVNAMPTATQATPSISVSSSGLITASATQSAGYVSAGTKSGTKQLTTQAAQTITPSTSSQTAVAKDVYTTGAVTVAGDSNLVPENIAEGVSIFGVTGTHSGGSGGGVETCTGTLAPYIMEFESVVFYVDGNGVFQTASSEGTISVMKNSIVIGEAGGNGVYASGNATVFNDYYGDELKFIYVTGDFTVRG